ncbi:GNAT family N-acetyltransferase [Umezawaea tangerina]|uniref:Acetyltransferase (GNAT) family protein n=1 Tax=Umezawaea tangerina TaxID=84725 RepID=A0A2T0T9D4_9PSEU|nr:GNAT family N-acetyltransferase [Umezawaea tangerina]PRY42264.1 acetyltransferase (GNAT) family protein [Umezawaea tangerina]
MPLPLLAELESFYDAVPRLDARAEVHGGLTLFVRDGEGFPYYARPTFPGGEPTAVDVRVVRERQRDLGVSQAFEWVHETTPGMLDVVEQAGFTVLRAPLLVLDGPVRVPEVDARVRVLDPEAPGFLHDVAMVRTIAQLSFSAPGTATGETGPRDRDTLLPTVTPVHVPKFRYALAEIPDHGPVATGMTQRAGDVAEVVGVGTLPSARRRGLGAAITAALAQDALDNGVARVFLSAGSEEIARVYERVGFRRVGTACIAETE